MYKMRDTFQGLLKYAEKVITDSGGLQKEAYFFRKYCITLREETEWTELVESIRDSVWADSVKWMESDLSVRKLFDQTPTFMGRYFWLEDAIQEVDQFDKNVSKAWAKATGGKDDESSLLTLFLCMARAIRSLCNDAGRQRRAAECSNLRAVSATSPPPAGAARRPLVQGQCASADLGHHREQPCARRRLQHTVAGPHLGGHLEQAALELTHHGHFA